MDVSGSDVAGRERSPVWSSDGEQPFLQLFSRSPDAILLLDPHNPRVSWPIIDCNDAACAMNGYRREELIGRSIDILNTTRGTRDERAAYLEGLRKEAMVSLETLHRHKDGHTFPVEVSTWLVWFGGRELVLGIDRDITARKRAEEALMHALESERASTDRLRELDQLKNTFLTAVSHDLRAPLTTVLGSALTLERLRPSLSLDDQDQLIRSISINAQRLQHMLTDLLDLDRLTRGVVEAVRTPTDLAGLVRRIVSDSGILDDHVVHLNLDPSHVDVDGPKVERIVDNLVRNARRYTAPETEVWIVTRASDEGVLLIVEDAGPGVPEAEREDVFEPFRQLGRSSRSSDGAGIGLSLVAKFAEIHGGRAWVEERSGGGSSFKVVLATNGSTTSRQPEPVAN